MTRVKITARIHRDLHETLTRLAAVKDKSLSDVVEDAIIKAFSSAGRDAEHAVLVAKLDSVTRRLGVLQHGQETLFELTAHAARFSMSIAPDIPEGDRVSVNARGSERFRNVIEAIVKRLSGGRSVWREHFAGTEPAAERLDAARQTIRAAE